MHEYVFRRRDLNDIIAHFNKESKTKKKIACVAKPGLHGLKSDALQ